MPGFPQFDAKGFMKVGVREAEKALGDALIHAIKRAEEIKEGLAVTVDSAKSDLAALVGAGAIGPLSAGLLSVIEKNEVPAESKGWHIHQGLYYRVDVWPAGIMRGMPVTLGPPDGPEIVRASWNGAAYLGVAELLTTSAPTKGRVVTAGVIENIPLGDQGFQPGDIVYVGDGVNFDFAKESQVLTGKQLIPVGVYLGRNVLKLVSAPATLKTA